MPAPRWIELARLADIQPGGAQTIKINGHQLAVFRDGDEIFAIDNRCPHEGYPLASGKLEGGMLTCEWHNWKFELCSGRCVLGGEDVRAYPLRREGDVVLIDLAPPADQAERLFDSLLASFEEADWSWSARVLERLLAAGVEAAAILDRVVALAAGRAPYGFDHGLAAAADLAARFDGSPADGERLLEACQLMVLPNLRRPPLAGPGDAAFGEAELRAAIEAEETSAAASIVRSALAAGVAAETVAGWLAAAASDHFLDYGHGEIYAVKAAELASRLGPTPGTASLLIALARGLALGTREDRLPYMRRFAALMQPHRRRLEIWAASTGDADLDHDALIDAALDGDLGDALGQVAAALDAGVAPVRIGLALAIAAGHRLARFDDRLESDPEVSHGWLDVTHLLTHADAAVEINRRWPGAAALRSLFHGARFIQHAAPLDHPAPPRLAAVDAETLWPAALAGGATPIFFAHRIKTAAAAVRTAGAIGGDRQLGSRADASIGIAAVARYLDAPIDERRSRARAAAARRFVQAGKRLTTRLGY